MTQRETHWKAQAMTQTQNKQARLQENSRLPHRSIRQAGTSQRADVLVHYRRSAARDIETEDAGIGARLNKGRVGYDVYASSEYVALEDVNSDGGNSRYASYHFKTLAEAFAWFVAHVNPPVPQ